MNGFYDTAAFITGILILILYIFTGLGSLCQIVLSECRSCSVVVIFCISELFIVSNVTVTATRLVSYGPDDQEGEEEDDEEEDHHASEDEMFSQFKSPSGVSTVKTPLEHL